MDTSPPSRCHLLRLANETLHTICGFLDEDGAYSELANLRLTCRSLQIVPEEYLFSCICLDTRFDCLESLQQLSQHQRISQHVGVLQVGIVFLTGALTHDEYNAQIAGYGSHEAAQLQERRGTSDDIVEGEGDVAVEGGARGDSEPDEDEEWLPRSDYDKLLAQERDSLGPEELAACWDCCQQTQLQQKKLKAMTLQELADFLQPIFARLPNLGSLNCGASGLDQYRWDEHGNRKLRLSQKRTLLPPIYHHEPDAEEHDSVVKYSAACLIALLLANPCLYSLELCGLPWDTLLALSDLFESHTALSTFAQITTLHLSLETWKAASDEDKARGMVVVRKMLAMAPELEEFQWVIGNHSGCELPRWDLPDRGLLSRLPKLRELTIGGARLWCHTADLQEFLTALPRHLQWLEFDAMVLLDGFWVDIFQFLQKRLRLLGFSFSELVECNTMDLTVRRWLVRHEEEATSPSLLERLRAYVTSNKGTPPLTPSPLGGSPETWKSKSDGPLVYERIHVEA